MVYVVYILMMAAVAATKVKVRVGVCLDKTTATGTAIPQGAAQSASVQQALSDIAASDAYPNITLEAVEFDTEGSPAVASNRLAKLLYPTDGSDPVRAVVGCSLSGGTLAVATLSSAFQIPHFVPASSSPELTSRTLYPYIARLISNDDVTGTAIMALMDKMAWKDIAVLYIDDAFGRGLTDYLTKAFSGTSRSATRFPVPVTVADKDILAQLDAIAATGLRVVLIQGSPPALYDLVHTVARSQYYKAPWVFVGTTWASQGSIHALGTNMGLSQQLNGLIAMAMHVPSSTPNWQQWEGRLLANHGPAFDGVGGRADTRVAAYYDSLRFLAKAAQNLAGEGRLQTATGAELYQAITSTSLPDSLQGPMALTNGEFSGAFDLVQWKDGNFVPRGIWQLGQNLTVSAPVEWIGGSTVVPTDRPQAYYDGDVLPHTIDSLDTVLAVVVSAVASWTAALLLEQAVTAGLRLLRKPRNQTLRPEKCPREQLEKIAWIVVASIAQGVAGIWAPMLFLSTSVRVAHIDEQFDGARIMIALLPAVLWTFLAFYLGVEDAVKAEAAEVVVVGAAGGTQQKRALAIWEDCMLPFKQASRLMWIAAVLQATGVVGTMFLIQTSPAHQVTLSTTSSGLFVLAVLLAVALSAICVTRYFYGKHVLTRAGGVVGIVGAILAAYHIALDAREFIYRPAVIGHETRSWGRTTVSTVAGSTVAVIIFVAFGLNVTKLRLSRRMLDQLLGKMQDQMRSMEKEVTEMRNEKLEVHAENDELCRMLDMINNCRPILRAHSLAVALADFSSSSTATGVSKRGGASEAVAATPGSVMEEKRPEWEPEAYPCSSVNRLKNEDQMVKILEELPAVALESGPVSDRAAQEVSLSHILDHPVTLEIFKDFIAKQLSGENLQLLLDIRRYKTLTKNATRRALASEILLTYIVSGAKHEVNISSVMRNAINRDIKAGNTDETLFESLEQEMLRLIVTNHMDSFVASSSFRVCCMILSHSSYAPLTLRKAREIREAAKRRAASAVTASGGSSHGDKKFAVRAPGDSSHGASGRAPGMTPSGGYQLRVVKGHSSVDSIAVSAKGSALPPEPKSMLDLEISPV